MEIVKIAPANCIYDVRSLEPVVAIACAGFDMQLPLCGQLPGRLGFGQFTTV